MTAFSAVYRKELLSLWVTPVAWIVLTAFLLLQGGIFYNIVAHFSHLTDLSLDGGPLEAYFGQQSVLMSMTLLLVCPPLTMRLFAEERRSGTIEPLLTTGITPLAAVLGKYFATLTTYIAIWLPTLLYALVLRSTGTVDIGVVASSYLGVFLIGCAYLALGLLMSSLTQSQLIALMLSVLAQFGLFVLSIGEYVLDAGFLHDVAGYVSLGGHMEEFSRGIVDLRRIAFGASLTLLCLYLAVRVVGSWRWR